MNKPLANSVNELISRRHCAHLRHCIFENSASQFSLDRFIVYPGKRDNSSLIHQGFARRLFFSLINSQKEFTKGFFRFENGFSCKTHFFQFKPYIYLGKVFSCNHSLRILWFLNTSLHHNRKRKQLQQVLLLVSRYPVPCRPSAFSGFLFIT